MLFTGDFYVGVDQATGLVVIVPGVTYRQFFGDYVNEHTVEVGSEHYREMQGWYQDTQCWLSMKGINRFGVVVVDPGSVVKSFRGDESLTLEDARNAGLQSPYARAMGWVTVVQWSNGSYDWFPQVQGPFKRAGVWVYDARMVEHWTRASDQTWVQRKKQEGNG
jgi:hypothetical protein